MVTADVVLFVLLQGWRLDVPSMPRLAEVAAWRGTRPAAAAPEGSITSSNQQQRQEAAGVESPMSGSPPPPPEGQQQQQHDIQAVQQQQQQDGRPDVDSVLGRPPPSAAIFHGGYYTQADVAKVC
jgi:hypothetical protein